MAELDWRSRLHVQAGGFAPLYAQLTEGLRSAIADLEPGDPIPSEKEIMEYSGVGRVTARKAIGDLVGEGLLVAIRGKGTFVAEPRIPTKLDRLAGFSETMRRLGRTPGSRILSAEEVSATGIVAERLRVEPGATIIRVERLRLIDGEPCMVETTHFLASLVPGMLTEDLEGSLYDLLRAKWGLVAARGSETVVAVNADRDLARVLGIPIASAVLATSRATFTDRGVPVEYTLRRARGDRCSFIVPLTAGTVLGDQSAADEALLPGPGA